MKRVKHIALAAATLAMVGVTGSAVAADSDIASTKHNLSSSGAFSNKVVDAASGTTEICVFCHTPHAANTAMPVPLWNRNVNITVPYTTYDSLGSSTLDGSIVSVGSVSLACLSCHDGTVAMDSLLNAPGSGNPDTNWTFDTSGSMSADGYLEDTTIAMLGTDLRDDHPVGILYAGGGVTAANTTNDKFKDGDFKDVTYVEINSDDYWYVDSDSNGKRTRTDIILYSRDEGDGVKPYVECASCHDPHVVGGVNEVAFLRITNAGSELCLACHIK